MSQRDRYREWVIQQKLKRFADEADRLEARIDNPVVSQHHLPCKDAQEIAGPERDRDQDQPDQFVFLNSKSNEVRHWISQQDGGQRYHAGYLDRLD